MSGWVTDSGDSFARAAAWRRLVAERFQLAPLAVLSVAQAASAQLVVAPRIDAAGLLIATVGVMAVLSLLRLMDEIKDVDKDKIAHPNRPLARGLLPVAHARSVVRGWIGTLLAASIILALVRSPVVGALYALCLALAALMYREFFASEFLELHTDVNGAVHQAIVLPLYAFATAAAFPDLALTTPVIWFGLAGMGASFTFEVARKLDPEAPAVLRTYLVVHGRNRAVGLIVLSLVLLMVAAERIAVAYIVWPVAGLTLLSLPLLYHRPERFRVIEALAGLVVLAQILAPTLHALIGGAS